MKVAHDEQFSSFAPIDRLCKPWFRQAELDETSRNAEANWLRDLLHARARRSTYFNSRLFADPAWDILLGLYHAELDQRTVSVGSLCLASGCPATTAIRWIAALEKDGFVARTKDAMDGRRVFIALTAVGSQAMRAYISSLPRSIGPAAS